MPDRFFAPIALDQESALLTGSEAHHLRDVLRLKVGAEVVLFDGQGVEATAEIVGMRKSQVEFRILESRRDRPAGNAQIVLGTAAPKGDRFRWLVEKGAELGVERLVTLNTARSVVDPRETRLEKMRAVVVAACKQSRRNRLMQIDAPETWPDFIQRFRAIAETGPARFLVADPSGQPLASELWSAEPGRAGNPALPTTAETAVERPWGETSTNVEQSSGTMILAVGPEGGFTQQELDLAIGAGARLVSLGPQILRVETAAIALASVFTLCKPRSS